jgi:predicted nucleic acid-binding protein
MIVADASVLAKWFLPEPGSDAAVALLQGPDLLAAPDIARLEVLSAILRRARSGLGTAAEARARVNDWLGHLAEGTVSLIAERELLNDAINLALEIKHPLPDCLYLAAARHLQVPLLTADRVFTERASKLFPNVQLLPGCEDTRGDDKT